MIAGFGSDIDPAARRAAGRPVPLRTQLCPDLIATKLLVVRRLF